MPQATMTLTVIKDVCLGHEVYRGSTEAGLLANASWIDFHDPDSNPHGYQRPFDVKRSKLAAEYANQVHRAFWPECILAIRDNDEVDDDNDKVDYLFTALEGTGGRFGTLQITYNSERTERINNELVPWRRALSQVDCQHRLGAMTGSKLPVTFCIFPGLLRREEAVIFRIINARQRKISTSLVDAIIQLTDPNAPIHIKWAWDLGRDPGSPFNQRVWTGGRGRPTGNYLINLAGLRESLQILVPQSYVNDEDSDTWYIFVRNFWNVVKDLWPAEFFDRANYKLQSTPGQGGLARFGQYIFKAALPTQETAQEYIARAFYYDPSRVDWAVNGQFRLATGKGGQRDVFEALAKNYGLVKS